jgi:hypothetical protein
MRTSAFFSGSLVKPEFDIFDISGGLIELLMPVCIVPFVYLRTYAVKYLADQGYIGSLKPK